MSKKLGIWLVISAVTLVTGLAWLALNPRGPFYQGKPLSFWLEAYATVAVKGPSPERQQAEDAVHHAGTKAIPTLLRMLRAADSSLKLKLLAITQRQHVIKIKFVPAGEQNYVASVGFRVMGATARDAAAALVETYDQNISYPSQLFSVDALGAIGPSAKIAVPALLRATANTNWVVRAQAVEALGKIHAEPALVVPVLTKFLNDPDLATRQRAAVALGSYGEDAKSAVPALVKAVDDLGIMWLATEALRAIDPEAAAAAGVK